MANTRSCNKLVKWSCLVNRAAQTLQYLRFYQSWTVFGKENESKECGIVLLKGDKKKKSSTPAVPVGIQWSHRKVQRANRGCKILRFSHPCQSKRQERCSQFREKSKHRFNSTFSHSTVTIGHPPTRLSAPLLKSLMRNPSFMLRT